MRLTLLLAAFAFTLVPCPADDRKDSTRGKAAEEASAAESKKESTDEGLPRVSAGDIEGVKKLVGKKAVVFGKVISTGEAKSGISFLNLDGGKFTVVTFKEHWPKFEDGQSPSKLYKGKEVEITGDIFEYRKTPNSSPQPEIKLTDPSQIRVIEPKKEEKGAKDEKESKEEKPAKKDEPKRVPAKKYFE
jgi:DNA/RNA endonuclease YhcR with UshA esterase domain